MNCPKCGNIIHKEHQKFCTFCGYKLFSAGGRNNTTIQTLEDNDPLSDTSNQKPSINKVFAFYIVLALIAIIISSILFK